MFMLSVDAGVYMGLYYEYRAVGCTVPGSWLGRYRANGMANGNARYDESTAVRRLGGSPTADAPGGLLRKTMSVLRK